MKRSLSIRACDSAALVAGVGGVLLLLIAFVTARGVALASSSAPGPDPGFPGPALDDQLAPSSAQASAVFAGGCFWGVQAVFERVKGVAAATSGYAGGPATLARYDDVSTGKTGHAESVRVIYDPAQITYGQLLRIFFSVAHDPTQLNRQGPDRGPQYRSVIFFAAERQHQIAGAYIQQLNGAGVFRRRVVTEVVPLEAFYPAEAYHQDYADKNPFDPYIMINDRPKIEKLRKLFPVIYVEHR